MNTDKEIIDALTKQVEYEKAYWCNKKEELDEQNWAYEQGVILSVNDADRILQLLNKLFLLERTGEK